jgi:ABC-type Fe3+-siderophore transport system permease subunit
MAEEPQNPELPRTVVDDRIETLRVRRAPKFGVFLLLGAALGVFVAMILTFSFNGTADPSASGVMYGQMQVFGFLALVGVAVGLLVGGAVALIFDRALARRTRSVSVDHERTHLDEA